VLTRIMTCQIKDLAHDDISPEMTLDELERLRKVNIGLPIYYTGITIPDNFIRFDGSFISFTDWPEFKEKYDSNGFKDMVISLSSSTDNLSKYRGKFRLSTDKSGLYTPCITKEFLRACASSSEPGIYQDGAMKNIYGSFTMLVGSAYGGFDSAYAFTDTTGVFSTVQRTQNSFLTGGWDGSSNKNYKLVFDASKYVNTDTEFRPDSIRYPVIGYLGFSTKQISKGRL
jgi:hypothetical protein